MPEWAAQMFLRRRGIGSRHVWLLPPGAPVMFSSRTQLRNIFQAAIWLFTDGRSKRLAASILNIAKRVTTWIFVGESSRLAALLLLVRRQSSGITGVSLCALF